MVWTIGVCPSSLFILWIYTSKLRRRWGEEYRIELLSLLLFLPLHDRCQLPRRKWDLQSVAISELSTYVNSTMLTNTQLWDRADVEGFTSPGRQDEHRWCWRSVSGQPCRQSALWSSSLRGIRSWTSAFPKQFPSGLWLVLFSWKMLALLTLACCAPFLSSWQSAGPAVLLWFVQSFLLVLSLQFMSLSVLSYIILGNFRNSWKCHSAIRERLRLWAGLWSHTHWAMPNCNTRVP